jgi:hypothetical protein
MTVSYIRPVYSGEFEQQLFDGVARRYAPNIPLKREQAPRDAQTPEERDAFVDFYVWSAAHDLFIVQIASHALDRLFRDDPDFQLVLARQIGDDGAHASASRDRIIEISGRDEIGWIAADVKAHWDRVGDIAGRSWEGFLAWELHFEHYIQAKLNVRRRTSEIADLPFRDYAEGRIVPDEEFHRAKITEWWLRKFDAAVPEQRAQWAEAIIAADDGLQLALNPYLEHSWRLTERVGRADIVNYVPLYDNVRREYLAFHLGVDADDLPPLTSLDASIAAQHAA